MGAPTPHPSLYELDQAVASGGTLPPHVAGCGECQAHVARVKAAAAEPAWLRNVERPRPRPQPWIWVGVALAASLVVALGVLARMPGARAERPGAYVGAKGAPEAALYVKRGDRVWGWSPGEAVQPGDLLRLAVMPAGYPQLMVATPEDGGWRLLYQGVMDPEREFDLPASWRVDAARGAEELLIVLSRRPVRPEELGAMAAREPRGDDVWTFHLRIEKISAP